MRMGKFFACVAGGAVAIVAAPVLLPIAAAAGGAALAAGAAVGGMAGGTAVTGVLASVGAAVTSKAVGVAAVGAMTAVGTGISTALTSTVAVVGASGVAAALGASATYSALTAKEGFDNLDSAKRLMAQAEWLHSKAKEHFEVVSARTARRLEALTIRRMEIMVDAIGPSIELIKRFRSVNESAMEDEDGNSILASFTPSELEQTTQLANEASHMLSEIKVGVSVMRAAAGGTVAFMSHFGVASTGTAISTLSGAAATNATLAALGGGALSVGGGGMALGSAVLGGVVIMPAAATVAYRFAIDAEKRLTEAHEHYASVVEDAAKHLAATTALKGVDKRVNELKFAMTRFADLYVDLVLPRLESVYERNRLADGSVQFASLSSEDKSSLIYSVQLLKSLKCVLGASVLDEQGNPSTESAAAIQTAVRESSAVSA